MIVGMIYVLQISVKYSIWSGYPLKLVSVTWNLSDNCNILCSGNNIRRYVRLIIAPNFSRLRECSWDGGGSPWLWIPTTINENVPAQCEEGKLDWL
jgi:hypothetical protein